MESLWAEGLSEPEAGSDLASLSTTATREGDQWIINGQKTYTTWGTHADLLYLAARTDPQANRHRGISIFCLDLSLPGVSFSPMENIAGGLQNHTFLDGVRLSNDMLIGEEGAGWSYIMRRFYKVGPLTFPHAAHARKLSQVLRACREDPDRREILRDSAMRERIAALIVDVYAEKVLSRQTVSYAAAGVEPPYAGAVEPVFTKEAQTRFAQGLSELVGPTAHLLAGSPGVLLDGHMADWYFESFGNHAGGTSQVKRMVLATRGLGLPR
jgi:alkylation response protein AidB-like acyl-CoA dehydrogenase